MPDDPSNCISRVTQILDRPNGAQVKLVAQDYGGPFRRDVRVDVFRRDSESDQWRLCDDRPHPNWRAMSVDEYTRHGRSERQRTVTFGELHRVTELIGKTPQQAKAMGATCPDIIDLDLAPAGAFETTVGASDRAVEPVAPRRRKP